jgi:hypothetical protein
VTGGFSVHGMLRWHGVGWGESDEQLAAIKSVDAVVALLDTPVSAIVLWLGLRGCCQRLTSPLQCHYMYWHIVPPSLHCCRCSSVLAGWRVSRAQQQARVRCHQEGRQRHPSAAPHPLPRRNTQVRFKGMCSMLCRVIILEALQTAIVREEYAFWVGKVAWSEMHI